MRTRAFAVALATASLVAFASHAAVTVSDAWVRGTVPAQRATGAFLTLQSDADATLVGVSSSLSESAQLHASEQQRGMMHMHAIDAVPLRAGRRVEL